MTDMEQAQQRKRVPWRWIALGGLVLAFVFWVLPNLGSSGNGGTASAYSATVTGQMETEQTVGEKTDVLLTVQNGDTRIPHLVVDYGGCSSAWVLDSATSTSGDGTQTSGGSYEDFGEISSGATWHGTLTMTPKDAGNTTCKIGVWPSLDTSTGIPDGDPLKVLSEKVAINP